MGDRRRRRRSSNRGRCARRGRSPRRRRSRVPPPISARGPITAPGSTVTPLSSRAVGCDQGALGHCRPPSNSDDGRSASGNSCARDRDEGAIGRAHQQRLTLRGNAWRPALAMVRQIPGELRPQPAQRISRCRRKQRSSGEARSSGAMPHDADRRAGPSAAPPRSAPTISCSERPRRGA